MSVSTATLDLAGHADEGRSKRLAALSLTAMGIVYGDIGTSPLYALRECFFGPHAVPVTCDNVLGVLSLIVWTLVIVVTLKYDVYVLRADNEGEGGILALMALATRKLRRQLGEARDTVIYSVLADEWPALKARLEARLADP